MNGENASIISARDVRRSVMRRPVIGSHGVVQLLLGLVVACFATSADALVGARDNVPTLAFAEDDDRAPLLRPADGLVVISLPNAFPKEEPKSTLLGVDPSLFNDCRGIGACALLSLFVVVVSLASAVSSARNRYNSSSMIALVSSLSLCCRG